MLLPILCRLPLLPSVPGVLRAAISFGGSIRGRQPGALCTTALLSALGLQKALWEFWGSKNFYAFFCACGILCAGWDVYEQLRQTKVVVPFRYHCLSFDFNASAMYLLMFFRGRYRTQPCFNGDLAVEPGVATATPHH